MSSYLRLECQWYALPEHQYLDLVIITFQYWQVLCAWAETTWAAIGVVDRHSQHTICSACEPCYVIRSEHSKFFAIFDCLVVLMDCSDAEMSRSGDFCADRQQQMTDKTNCFTPCACAWGNNMSHKTWMVFNFVKWIAHCWFLVSWNDYMIVHVCVYCRSCYLVRWSDGA